MDRSGGNLKEGIIYQLGSRDNLLVQRRTRDRKVEFESRQGRRENFLLQSQLSVLIFIRCPFHPMLHSSRKRPDHSAKPAGGRPDTP